MLVISVFLAVALHSYQTLLLLTAIRSLVTLCPILFPVVSVEARGGLTCIAGTPRVCIAGTS